MGIDGRDRILKMKRKKREKGRRRERTERRRRKTEETDKQGGERGIKKERMVPRMKTEKNKEGE